MRACTPAAIHLPSSYFPLPHNPPPHTGEECYLALDKGAISDLHVLVVPVEHYPSSLAAPATTLEEMER